METDAFAFCFVLEEVLFYTPAPTIGSDAFYGVDAIAAYYDDGTWTTTNRLGYGGSLTWQYFPGHRVTFQNWNGRMICTDFYDYGETIFVPNDPERPNDSAYTYTFAGWSPAVNEICTGEVAYTATYRAIKREELPGDTTGDGVLNNDDVIYLLWHTLFGDQYPLP